MGLFFFLALLSLPVFYILGVIYFIKGLINKESVSVKQDPRRQEILRLEAIIADLEIYRSDFPERSLDEQIEVYKSKLRVLKVTADVQSPPPVVSPSPQVVTILEVSSGGTLPDFWSNWYSKNSINLLLYVGAFLIVAAASIFVSFQWELISGDLKAGLLSLLSVAFFSLGLWFYNLPKVRNAGSTFVAIGALLVPICGAAWYKFVFEPLGVPAGSVWLITSIISLSVYALLGHFLDSNFYVYLSSVATLSLSLSVVNTAELKQEFYVLSGIVTSCILLFASFVFGKGDKGQSSNFRVPLEVSSEVMMPVSLVFGLYLSLIGQRLVSLETTTSVLLAALFYLLSYKLFPRSWKLAAFYILVPLGLVIFFNWRSWDSVPQLLALDLCSVVFIMTAWALLQKSLFEEANAALIISWTILVLVFTTSAELGLDFLYLSYFALVPAVCGLATAYLKKDIRLTLLTQLFLAIFIYYFWIGVLKLADYHEGLGLVYLLTGIINYRLLVAFKGRQEYLWVFGVATFGFIFLSLLLTFPQTSYLLITTLSVAALFLAAAYELGNSSFLYASNVFIYVSLFNLLKLYDFPEPSLPLAFLGLSLVLYLVSLSVPTWYRTAYRVSSLLGSAALSWFFGKFYVSSFDVSHDVEASSLMASYGSVGLYGLDLAINNTPNFGYVVSAIALITYIWNINFLGVTDTLLYTLPIGVYFLVVSYFRRCKKDFSGSEVLDLLGLFFLLVPTLFLSFGQDAIKYSVILGILGISLFVLGISLSHRIFKFGGIASIVAAIVPQTYSYILSLPRYLIVGVLGLTFLAVATYLLMRRQEAPKVNEGSSSKPQG